MPPEPASTIVLLSLPPDILVIKPERTLKLLNPDNFSKKTRSSICRPCSCSTAARSSAPEVFEGAASCASAAPAAPLAVRYHDVLVVPLLVADLLVAFAEHRRESNFSFFERATEASCNSLSALGNRRARRRSSLRIWQKVFSRFCLLAAPASGPEAGRGQKSAAGASQEKRKRGLPGKGADTGREEKELIPAYQGLIPGYQGLIPRKSP